MLILIYWTQFTVSTTNQENFLWISVLFNSCLSRLIFYYENINLVFM
jgi:hypothetical protein